MTEGAISLLKPSSEGSHNLYKSATTSTNRKVIAATTGSVLGSTLGALVGLVVAAFLIPGLKHLGADIPDSERKAYEDSITGIFTVVTAGFLTHKLGYNARPDSDDSVVKDYSTPQ